MTAEAQAQKVLVTFADPRHPHRGLPPFGYFHILKVYPDGGRWSLAHVWMETPREMIQEFAERLASQWNLPVEWDAAADAETRQEGA